MKEVVITFAIFYRCDNGSRLFLAIIYVFVQGTEVITTTEVRTTTEIWFGEKTGRLVNGLWCSKGLELTRGKLRHCDHYFIYLNFTHTRAQVDNAQEHTLSVKPKHNDHRKKH